MRGGDPLPIDAGPVRLRRLTRRDLSALQAYGNDPEVGRFQSWEPMDDARALAFIDAAAAGPFAPPGEWNQFAIADAATDDLIGDIGVHQAADGKRAEIGFTLAAEAQGKGLGFAAAEAAIRAIFGATDVEWIVAITDALNAPSIRLLERLGMTRIAEEDAMFRGAPCVEYVYELRRTHPRAP